VALASLNFFLPSLVYKKKRYAALTGAGQDPMLWEDLSMPIPQNIPPRPAPRRGWKRNASLGLALLTCPCHLPLLLGALAGTALGGWLSRYTLVVFLALLGLFVLALLYGFGALDRRLALAATLAHHRTDSEQSLKGGT